MQIARGAALLTSLALFACGDDGGPRLIDSGIGNTDVAPKVCTQITVGAGDIDFETITRSIGWFNPTNEMILGMEGGIFTEFYRSVTPNITGAIDLSAAPQNNYAECGVCFLVRTATQAGLGPSFFQESGTVTFTEDPITARRLNVTVSNLTLREATIDENTFESTFVPNGECVVLNGTFNEDNIPTDWSTTCTAGDYYTGMPTSNCDCGCGVYEPDCAAPGAGDRVIGCTNGGTPQCWPDENTGTACVARPANDDCGTNGADATTLTINAAAIAGTTLGASRDFKQSGQASTNTCTPYIQSGPDVVYKATLAAATAYTITVTNADESRDPSIYVLGPDANGDAAECTSLVTACAASSGGGKAGADTGAFGENEVLNFTPAAAGTYYIVVDTDWSTPVYGADPASSLSIGGPFTIQLTQP